MFSDAYYITVVSLWLLCAVFWCLPAKSVDLSGFAGLGRYLPAWIRRPKRRLVHAPKFYLFDIGLTNVLNKRGRIEQGSELFGRAFEHFIVSETFAWSQYSETFKEISYWRSASGYEVDLVLGDMETLIEIKGCDEINSAHHKSIRICAEEHTVKKKICVALVPKPRMTDDGIEILPWKDFLSRLWLNEYA